MTKTAKQKVNLEKIITEGMLFGINKNADNETDLSKKIPTWIKQYVKGIYGEEQADATYEILQRDPLKVTPLISQAMNQHESNLITEVKKAPIEVAKNIRQDYAIELASEFFGDTSYKTLKEAIENNGNVKAAYSEAFDGDMWKNLVAIATPEAVREAARGYFQRATRREVIKNLCDKEGAFNTNKSAKYITSNIQKQTVDTQRTSYKDLGLAYLETILS